MGFDVSYHPISEEEIKHWYFDVLIDPSKIEKLSDDYSIDDFYKQKYMDTVAIGNKTGATEFFDNTHGYYIAVIQGFFRIYFYTRGAAFSFLIEENQHFKTYTKGWQEVLGFPIENPVKNRISDNYSGGVYIPADKVAGLLNDFKTDDSVKEVLENYYSHKRINVFLKALEYASDHSLGLLEATEVVEPNPMELNKSISYSNLFNCDKDGPFLYEAAALEQIKDFETQGGLKSGEISGNVEYVKTQVGDAEKKLKNGFWKKLFGK